jgi:hypothetical protein
MANMISAVDQVFNLEQALREFETTYGLTGGEIDYDNVFRPVISPALEFKFRTKRDERSVFKDIVFYGDEAVYSKFNRGEIAAAYGKLYDLAHALGGGLVIEFSTKKPLVDSQVSNTDVLVISAKVYIGEKPCTTLVTVEILKAVKQDVARMAGSIQMKIHEAVEKVFPAIQRFAYGAGCASLVTDSTTTTSQSDQVRHAPRELQD